MAKQTNPKALRSQSEVAPFANEPTHRVPQPKKYFGWLQPSFCRHQFIFRGLGLPTHTYQVPGRKQTT